MGKTLIPPEPAEIHEVMLRDALEERYLQYALSTIMHRALPDARDGLKPVHRRILYGMRLLRLDPGTPFKKSAKIVGDVMGSFHPHGDQSIYDALVRLAQEFSVRYPLIEGQGNFGNIDGDNPAAMRYTEARLTAVAEALLQGIDENAVDFRPNYDGSAHEPIVLPGVMTPGAAQALVKTQGVLPGRRALVAGTGPFLLIVAEQLHRAGVDVVGVVEMASRAEAFRAVPGMLAQPRLLWEGWRSLRRLKRAGIAVSWAHVVIEARGEGEVGEAIVAPCDEEGHPDRAAAKPIAVDTLCVGYGFVPRIQLAQQ